MATKNDITGDSLISRGASKAYLDNYDLIFRKGNPKKEEKNDTGSLETDQRLRREVRSEQHGEGSLQPTKNT